MSVKKKKANAHIYGVLRSRQYADTYIVYTVVPAGVEGSGSGSGGGGCSGRELLTSMLMPLLAALILSTVCAACDGGSSDTLSKRCPPETQVRHIYSSMRTCCAPNQAAAAARPYCDACIVA